MAIDLTLPIWRLGEMLLYASRLAKLLGDDPEILIMCQFSGLRNRRLVSMTRFFDVHDRQGCMDDVVTLETQATAQRIEDNLVEILHSLLSPLYELFPFSSFTQAVLRNRWNE
jgi:hypothetical protein